MKGDQTTMYMYDCYNIRTILADKWSKSLTRDIELFTKEVKNAPKCIIELYKHLGIFNPLPTRAKHTKQPAAILNF